MTDDADSDICFFAGLEVDNRSLDECPVPSNLSRRLSDVLARTINVSLTNPSPNSSPNGAVGGSVA